MQVALYENQMSGGGKRAAFELARALTAHGHVVDLWTSTAADASFVPLERVTRRQFRYEWPHRRRVERRLPGLRGYLVAVTEVDELRRVAEVAREMALEIDRGGYDFALVNSDWPIHAPYLLRYLRTPSVYYCQEPNRDFYDPPIARPYHRRPAAAIDRWQQRWYAPGRQGVLALRKREERANVRYATTLLANSYFSAEAIYRAYDRRALASYLGVDVDLFRPLGLPRQDYVISVGRVEPRKGFDFLIEALGCMPAGKRPPLLIVANLVQEAEQTYLRDLAGRWTVSLEIRCRVTDEELARLYNEARAMVYAPVMEPFGLAPVEAMACGTPVVGVAEGGVRESVRDGETGLLTQRVPAHFAAALERVLGDEDLQAGLRARGLSAARSFWTWPAAYERFIDLVGVGLGQTT